MAKISEENPGMITDNGFQICFFCEDNIDRGGCWAGSTDLGVCSKCSHKLLDLLIDTLEDTNFLFKQMSISEKQEYITLILLKQLKKKATIDKNKLNNSTT